MDRKRFDVWEDSVAWALKRAGLLLFVANIPELTMCVVEDFEDFIPTINLAPKRVRSQMLAEHIQGALDARDDGGDLWPMDYMNAYCSAAAAVVELELDCDCHGGRQLVDIGGGDTDWEDCTCFRAGREG
jgi:hypothetical protein